MKEKRYFCDSKLCNIKTWLLFIGLVSLISISIGITQEYEKYKHLLNAYSEEVYSDLVEIQNNVIEKNVGINLSAIPENVINYEIIYENDEIIFTYYIEENNEIEYKPQLRNTVTLSKDFDILSEESLYSSKQKYVDYIKFNLLANSLATIVCPVILLDCFLCLVCIAAYAMSKRHKEDNLEKINLIV